MRRTPILLALALGLALAPACKKGDDNAKGDKPKAAEPAKDDSAKAKTDDGAKPAPKEITWYCADATSRTACALDPGICMQANNNTPCVPFSPVYCFSFRHEEKGDSMACHASEKACQETLDAKKTEADPKVQNPTACAARN